MLISQESGFLCHKGWCKESLPTPSKTLVSSPAPGHYSAVVLKVQLLHILLTSQKAICIFLGVDDIIPQILTT